MALLKPEIKAMASNDINSFIDWDAVNTCGKISEMICGSHRHCGSVFVLIDFPLEEELRKKFLLMF